MAGVSRLTITAERRELLLWALKEERDMAAERAAEAREGYGDLDASVAKHEADVALANEMIEELA